MTKNGQEKKIEEQSAHASTEMAQIILAVTQAIQSDDEAIAVWSKRTAVDRQQRLEKWEELSAAEKIVEQRNGAPLGDEGAVSMRRQTRAYRRKLRYKIFRLREGKWQTDKELAALKAWYELQFQEDGDGIRWTFADFTFKWDISAVDPLKVITPFEWDGTVLGGVGGKMCDPSAFTKQDM